MPGYKITDLTSLGALAADAPNDLVEVVDVSDTVTAPADGGGSNKKITIHDLVLAANQQLTVPQDAAGLNVSGAVTTPNNTRDHLVKIAQSFSSLGVDGEENPYIPDTKVSLLKLEATFPADDPGALASFHRMVNIRSFVPDYGDTEMTTRLFIDTDGNIYTTGAVSCAGILGAIEDLEAEMFSHGPVRLQGFGVPGLEHFVGATQLGLGHKAGANLGNQVMLNPGSGNLALVDENPIELSLFRTYTSDTQWARGAIAFNSNDLVIRTSSLVETRGALRFDVATSVAPLTTNNTTLGTTSLRWSTIFGTALTVGSGLTALTGVSNASALTVAGGNLTGSNSSNAISLTQTWNTTGSPKAISVNITNTASGAGARLLDLQTGGTSRFSVDASGNTTIAADAVRQWNGRSRVASSADEKLNLTNSAGSSFTMLTLGPETASFTGLKANGVEMQVRLGDDSAFGSLRCHGLTTESGSGVGAGRSPLSTAFLAAAAGTASKASINLGSGVAPSSPVNGDIWFDGTNLYFRGGGVTKQIATV